MSTSSTWTPSTDRGPAGSRRRDGLALLLFSSALVAGVVVVACSPSAPATPTEPPWPTAVVAPRPPRDQNCQRLLCARPYHSPYEVTLETSPSPMSYKGRTIFTVRVKDPEGRSLANVAVGLWAAHATDPRVDAGPLALERVADGVFSGSLFLNQKGSYQVTVGVRGPRGEGDHAFDRYTVI